VDCSPTITGPAFLVPDYSEMYKLGCFRNEKTCSAVRLYLAFFHKRPKLISPRGDSNVSLRAQIADLGLPTDYQPLLDLYLKHLEFRRVSREDALGDLELLEDDLSLRLESPQLVLIPPPNGDICTCTLL
ncbi:hypothetical protein M8J75_002956, partial [Diaphorina citri]